MGNYLSKRLRVRCLFFDIEKAVYLATNGFLVEVAGLELAASSTRNWRATNCATPRSNMKLRCFANSLFIILYKNHFVNCFLKYFLKKVPSFRMALFL